MLIAKGVYTLRSFSLSAVLRAATSGDLAGCQELRWNQDGLESPPPPPPLWRVLGLSQLCMHPHSSIGTHPMFAARGQSSCECSVNVPVNSGSHLSSCSLLLGRHVPIRLRSCLPSAKLPCAPKTPLGREPLNWGRTVNPPFTDSVLARNELKWAQNEQEENTIFATVMHRRKDGHQSYSFKSHFQSYKTGGPQRCRPAL